MNKKSNKRKASALSLCAILHYSKSDIDDEGLQFTCESVKIFSSKEDALVYLKSEDVRVQAYESFDNANTFYSFCEDEHANLIVDSYDAKTNTCSCNVPLKDCQMYSLVFSDERNEINTGELIYDEDETIEIEVECHPMIELQSQKFIFRENCIEKDFSEFCDKYSRRELRQMTIPIRSTFLPLDHKCAQRARTKTWSAKAKFEDVLFIDVLKYLLKYKKCDKYTKNKLQAWIEDLEPEILPPIPKKIINKNESTKQKEEEQYWFYFTMKDGSTAHFSLNYFRGLLTQQNNKDNDETTFIIEDILKLRVPYLHYDSCRRWLPNSDTNVYEWREEKVDLCVINKLIDMIDSCKPK